MCRGGCIKKRVFSAYIHACFHGNDATQLCEMYVLAPPPSTWKPELKGEDRRFGWINAAGFKKDGSSKAKESHRRIRISVWKKDSMVVIKKKRKRPVKKTT
jgi:hypothetical protein